MARASQALRFRRAYRDRVAHRDRRSLGSFRRRKRHVKDELIRRYRRYLRLIDRKSRVWFHVLEMEVSMTPATVTERRTGQTTDKTAIRPFRFEAPEAELIEMRRRITATRFPEKETVTGFSQGVQLAFIQALARYWATDYNWRRCEAQLNSHPQFITEIDGLDTTLRAAQVRCIANREPEASEKWHLRGTRRKRRRI